MIEKTTRNKRAPKGRTNSNNSIIIQTCLEEHRALRNEIEQHHVSMRYMTIFNITASGTIFSFVLSSFDAFKSLLLIIPILSSILGMIFFFHSIRMSQLGHYIQHTLAPKIRLLTNDNSVLNWEYYVRQQEQSRGWLKWLSLDGIRLGTYTLICGIALVAAPISGVNISVTWIIGLLLTIALVMLTMKERDFWLSQKEE